MCIDIFAPGRAVTLPFLHEQIWYEVGHNRLHVNRYCDVFVMNEGDSAIEQLRIHISRYVPPQRIVIGSGSSVPSECQSSWYCRFTCTGPYTESHSRVTLTLLFEATNREEHTGRILKGSFQPRSKGASQGHGGNPDHGSQGEGLIPVAGTEAGEFMRHMKELDLTVLDFHLDEPLAAGDTGWLRLEIQSPEGSRNDGLIGLPPSPLLRDPHRFVTRRKILCPRMLREKVRSSLECAPYQRWVPEVLVHGLNKPGTLTRIEDHRVTLIVPEDVQASDISTYPHETIVPVAPYPVGTAPRIYAIHMMTGSRINGARDTVLMAKRILEYLRTVYQSGATVEHLVNRFGSDQQEAIGLLVLAMIRTGVLVEPPEKDASTRGSREPCYAAVRQEFERAKLVDLRRNYADLVRDEPNARYASRIRELHPFSISFTLSWTAYSESQRARLASLGRIAEFVERSRRLEGVPREAVVVVCSKYNEYFSPTELKDIGSRLCRGLGTRGQFVVSPVFNPTTGDAILSEIREVLARMRSTGTFLLWFVGHGVPCPNAKYLHLLHTCSKNGVGVEYSQINHILEEHLAVNKIVVLDCCHSEYATDLPAPANTLVWPTAGRNDMAVLDKECGVIVPGVAPGDKPKNFTFRAAEILCDGDPVNPSEVITYRELFERAAEHAPHTYEGVQHGAIGSFPIGINATHAQRSFEELLQYAVLREADPPGNG